MVLIRFAKFVTAGFLAVVSFAVLPPDAVADSNVAVLAFGLVGSQSVFESEAKGAAAQVILKNQEAAGRTLSARPRISESHWAGFLLVAGFPRESRAYIVLA
jgi:hypothetical protein